MQFQSAIYDGWVQHRRHHPSPHHFRYGTCMFFLDLDELDRVMAMTSWVSADAWAPARFVRSDYFGDSEVPLKESIHKAVSEVTGSSDLGSVRLLTTLRMFGQSFNPVSFYYCYDGPGERLQAILAEITNTPWRERRAIVLPVESRDASVLRFQFDKDFHVSPFMSMDQEYDWRFTVPEEALTVHMVNRERGISVFDASLGLRRRPMNARELRRAVLRFPIMGVRVLAGIHWQALRLWLKRIPVHDHPGKRSAGAAHETGLRGPGIHQTVMKGETP